MKAPIVYPQGSDDNFLKKRLEDISGSINSIEFGDKVSGAINISCFPFQTTTPNVANTEFTVNHNLGRIPTVLLFTGDTAGHVYASRRNQWTAKQAFFKSDQANLNFTGFII